jgi:hypothetical protein
VRPIRQVRQQGPASRVRDPTKWVSRIGNHMVTHYGDERRGRQARLGLPGIYIRETSRKLRCDTFG